MGAVVSIVQPYIPRYRVAFFDRLRDALAADGITVNLVVSQPAGAQSARGDSAEPTVDVDEVHPRTLSIGRISFTLTNTSGFWRGADAVILPLEGSSLDVYRAMSRRRGGLRVGLWGHVLNYVAPANILDVRLERALMRRADQVFAYTASGANAAVEAGVDPMKVRMLRNTIDTQALESAVRTVTKADAEAFRSRHGLRGPTFGYLGGLDASKRIDYLAAALEEMWSLNPAAKVIVAGHGDQAGLLNVAASRGQVIMLGYADARSKALIGEVSSALLMPGRIGLVAVDALTLRLPIITSEYPWHGPEREYLKDGSDVLVVSGGPRQFALAALSSDLPKVASAAPGLDGMVSTFADGVRALVASKPGRSESRNN
ncbi:glycosyltransferase [Microbacterium oleivorans]|uniref:glycosyltransferase n=1 Tax=Microbacterium oleivorans TaxID=273677 RepID=UPI0033F27298